MFPSLFYISKQQVSFYVKMTADLKKMVPLSENEYIGCYDVNMDQIWVNLLNCVQRIFLKIITWAILRTQK